MRTLSKTDFKVAQECPTKLFYRTMRYPDRKEEDEYLELLAEGGYAVGKLAQLLHPGGEDLGGIGSTEEAVRRTLELMQRDAVTIYEAAVLHGNHLVRVDVLVKRGRKVELVEVKATSVDSTSPELLNSKGELDRAWIPYVEDVAYQTMVVRLAFPELAVEPFLMMPDKSRTTAIEGLNGQFMISKEPAPPGGRFRSHVVTFTGDAEALREDALLAKVPIAPQVEPMLPNVAKAAKRYADSLLPEPVRIPPTLSITCARCEYRKATNDPARDGFRQCWGALADVTPSVLDLYRAGNFRGELDGLIQAGKVALSDVQEELLMKADGTPKYDGRPLLQIKQGRELITPELKAELHSWTYPLHFIDFETSRMALPYHQGMRPYEQIAFQWSCHTIPGPSEEPRHQEWINTVDAFPSFGFARSLMEALGRTGTVLMWSHHERTTLRDIRRQMAEYGHDDVELADWLDRMAPSKESGSESPLVDMDALARKGYFHPLAGGRTSIKVTLPAVLQAHRSPRIPRWLARFAEGVDLLDRNTDGLINPYKLLPAIRPIESYGAAKEEDEAYLVSEGTAAMRAYQDMLYGLAKADPGKQGLLRQALLNYCKLDTLAMVVIWEHWRWPTGEDR